MNTRLILGLSALTALLTCTGCAALQSAPPTKGEAAIYDIATNITPREIIVLKTNIVEQVKETLVPHVVDVTNFTYATVLQTNLVPVVVNQTNTVLETNYQYAVSAKTKAGVEVAGMVANTAMPGAGTLVSAALAGILGLWGTLRSKQANTAQAVAANSVQVIQTARNIVASLDPKVGAAYDAWMRNHQQVNNVALAVAQVVDDHVDDYGADKTAEKLLASAAAPINPAPAPAPAARTGTGNLG